ncbi:MAG: hypothetical protein HYU28_01650 [Actinobacteria bacterium]|nr:hypothetical protein [Actinomycetota bacterium]
MFPTCLVEYQEPGIGRDFVRVCERNGVAVELADGPVCCGMPWLDAGDADRFLEHAEHNVTVLAPHAAAGRDIVVLQPTCGYVLRREYPAAVGTDEARDVGRAVKDPSEYLLGLHKEGRLDTDFPGTVPKRIAWHEPCHLKAQQIGPKARDLMALTGAEVVPIAGCSGIDGSWGYRAENETLARQVARPLVERIVGACAPCTAGDCHLANGVIAEETGAVAVHPVQVIARAYGIPEEGKRR